MNKTAAALLVGALLAIPAGVGWIYPPAGVIAVGVILAGLGILLLDAKASK